MIGGNKIILNVGTWGLPCSGMFSEYGGNSLPMCGDNHFGIHDLEDRTSQKSANLIYFEVEA